MKILKIIIITILVLAVLGVIGLTVFIKTFDINRYKGEIVGRIESQIGRDVTIGSLAMTFSLPQGVRLSVRDLTVGDDPNFSSEDFLRVDRIDLGVDLGVFMRERTIHVTDISLSSPWLNIIRDKEGSLNIQSLQPASLASLRAPVEEFLEWASGGRAIGNPVVWAQAGPPLEGIVINSVRVEAGIVAYTDRSFSPDLAVRVTDVSLAVDQFRLGEYFPFRMQGSLWSTDNNLDLKGQALVNLDEQYVALREVNSTIDLQGFVWSDIRSALAFVPSLDQVTSLEGTVTKKIPALRFNFDGSLSYQVDAELKNGQVACSSFPVPLKNIHLHTTGNEKRLDFKTLAADFAEGTISGSGWLDDMTDQQTWALDIQASEVDLSRALPQPSQDGGFRLIGRGTFDYSLNAKGLNPDQIQSTLAGQGSLVVQDGKLVNVNILRVVLQKMSMFPNLMEKFEANLPEKYKKLFQQKDTDLKIVRVQTVLQGETMNIRQGIVETEAFRLDLQGTVNLKGELDATADMFIPKDLSDSMIETIEEFRYIADPDGRIRIPLLIKGRIPEVKPFPDIKYLSQKVFQQKGRKELDKLLDKVFGVEEKKPSSGQGDPAEGRTGDGAPSQTGQEEEIPPERELINNVLDAIFGQ